MPRSAEEHIANALYSCARMGLKLAAPKTVEHAPTPAARLPPRKLTLFSHSPEPPRKYWFSMYRKWRALRIAWMYAHWMLLSTVSPRSAQNTTACVLGGSAHQDTMCCSAEA